MNKKYIYRNSRYLLILHLELTHGDSQIACGFGFFEDLSEPIQAGKILYPLKEILLVMLFAVLGGADSFVEIAQFGKCKLVLQLQNTKLPI